jgi:DNA polymerase-4
MAERKIIHIDMDAFYASVEQRDFPELRGRPVVVGGRPDSRGVVAAASYEARTFGIRSAMPAARAHKLCAHAVFVRPRFDVYRQVSQQIRAVFREVTDLVEPLSLDEAYLDVTENKLGNPSATLVANQVRAEILTRTQLTASAGVAPNKFLAKIASDINKPNGICVIPPARVTAFIEQLPIGKFFGIGKATEKKMHELGIFKGADLKQREEVELIRHFGKTGSFYFRIARGIDDRPVSPDRTRKSVGVEETFATDLVRQEEMERVLRDLAEELARRLGKAETSGKTVTLKLRYSNFETITRAQTGREYLREAEDIYAVARRHLLGSGAIGKPVRLLGITVSSLDNQPDPLREIQLPLPFPDYEF